MTVPVAGIPVEAATGALWDVVVVGSGVGGATIGHRLAMAGHRVLFLEKGKADFVGPSGLDGEVEGAERRLDAALWPDPVKARVDGRESEFFAPLGCGAGGSSILYAATLERFERSDVEPVDGPGGPTGGWPVGWDEMTAYYAEAERLYRVSGTRDPLSDGAHERLSPPPPASPTDERFMQVFAGAGLHPYRLHVGFGYKPGCTECGGRRCAMRCKSDARLVCLEPALGAGRAALLAECEVVKLEATADRVDAVVFRHEGDLHRVRGRTVVLAAGAYRSAALLLRSKSATWPDGLANGSGLVGRNLMFHANVWLAAWPDRKLPATGPRKTIGLRDFYRVGGVPLGALQSTALSADYGNIYLFLLDWFDRSRWRKLKFLRPFLRVPAKVARLLFGKATLFAMIVQDFAHPENRVVLDEDDPDRVRIVYDIPAELRARTELAHRLLKRAFAGLRMIPLRSDVQLNFGHPCGTCRFGTDPETSVLDADCKAHEFDNLYVVDASFMPTSGGANPSLTIIANALRVGDALHRRLTVEALETA